MMKVMSVIILSSIAVWGQCDSGVKMISEKKIIQISVDDQWCRDTLQYKLDSVDVSFCAVDIAQECRKLERLKDEKSKRMCLSILDSSSYNLQKRFIQTTLLFGYEEFAFRIAKKGRVQVIMNGVILESLILADYLQYARNSSCVPDGGTKGVGLFLINGSILLSENKGWFD